jgi:hypothetical protein
MNAVSGKPKYGQQCWHPGLVWKRRSRPVPTLGPTSLFGFSNDEPDVMIFSDPDRAIWYLCLPDVLDGVMEFYAADGQRFELVAEGRGRDQSRRLVPDRRGPQPAELRALLIEHYSRFSPLDPELPDADLLNEAAARADPK